MMNVRGWRTTAVVGALVLSGCDDLLTVRDPSVILPEDLVGVEGAPVLYAGAVGDFAEAWSSGDPGAFGVSVPPLVVLTGLLSDEFVLSGALIWSGVDRRSIDIDALDLDSYYRIHRARTALGGAGDAIARYLGEADPRLAEVRSLEAYTYVLLAESFCNGVTVSSVGVDGEPVHGPPMPGSALLEEAVARFQAVLGQASTSPVNQALARSGMARALLALGRAEEAANVADKVPAGFVYLVGHSDNSSRQHNGVYAYNTLGKQWSLADSEGGSGLPFRSAMDPRVRWGRHPANNTGADRATPQYDLLSVGSERDPLALASATEARLIEAEAALLAGSGEWLTILRELRVASGLDFSSVAPLEDRGSFDENVDLLFGERAFWLFATGQRLPDLRRLVRQYGRSAEAVFPSGAYFKGGSYGPDLNLPIPRGETANPLSVGCTDRDA